MSLVKPPGRPRISFLAGLGRFVMTVLVIGLIAAFGWAVFTSNTIQREENVDPTVNPPGRFVSVPNFGQLHVRELSPGGRAVMLIHDFDLAGGYQWLPIAEQMESASLLIPDLMDFGFSDRPSDPGRLHTIIGRAETMAGLLETLELDSVVVVGAGLGGAVAAELAALDSAPVERLVLIAPEILGPPPTWESYLYSFPILADAMNFTFIGAGSQADNRYSAGCETGGWCPSLEDLAVRDFSARVPGTAEALTAMAQTPEASTLPDSLSTIDVPTLILWGDSDAVTPLEQGEEIAAAIEGAELAVVPGTGHRPHREDPAAVASLIATFLQG
ncbi:MAG TPA: alpha/beta hydrolase [Acidimicrobiia bacterium]|jgi:pimeloyl-ACP methyl ester carboxylesterase